MADAEWFEVQSSSGGPLRSGEGTQAFTNKEAAAAFARTQAPQRDDVLTVVKYTRKEIRTFRRKVSIEEADVPAA